MQMIINLPDEVMTELLQVTQTQNQAKAIQIAIQGWLHYQQQQLEPQELVGTTLSKTKQIDLMQYAGKISWPVDGVVYQRQVRDEWEK
ncbi:MAG: hypothetical protein HC877_20580 [Thioploca sp.]|nr:hypothetical protein [Thioploca sp.]